MKKCFFSLGFNKTENYISHLNFFRFFEKKLVSPRGYAILFPSTGLVRGQINETPSLLKDLRYKNLEWRTGGWANLSGREPVWKFYHKKTLMSSLFLIFFPK